MEKGRYDSLVGHISGLIDSEALSDALSAERKDRRTDMVLALVRDALYRSEIGIYNGVMYHFSGRIYEPIEADDFGNLIYDVLRAIGVPFGDFSKIEGFIKVCRRRVMTKPLSVSKEVMVFRNCVLDIGRGEVHGFSRDYVQFSAADYDYDPGARGYVWQDFLNDVLPNRVYQMILQEYVGSLFIDRKRAKMETMLVLLGSGSNGKSVVFQTVVGLIGEQNVSHFGISELIGDGNEKKRNLATMNGKRLNYASETKAFTIDGGSGMLKAIISGEPVEARPMYGDNFTASDLPLIMINANKMPVLKDFSYGMRRRLTVIPFERTIPVARQNRELGNELRAEYPAIFNWAMAGRERFVGNGYKLTECSIMEDVLDDYQTGESNVLQFMRERKYLRANETVTDAQPLWRSFNEIYSEYKRWCLCHDEVVEQKKAASGALTDYGFRRRRTGRGVEFAIFGEAAYLAEIRRRREERVTTDISDAEAVRERLGSRKREEIRRRFALVFRWDRVALGFRELMDYTGYYTCNMADEMRKGRLDGAYRFYNGVYVFNLDLIDTMWKPMYEERVRRSEEAREARRREHDEMRAYTELEIEQYFSDLDAAASAPPATMPAGNEAEGGQRE